MDPERIVATYLIETPLAVEQAAAVLAGEQSTGTFVEVPGETQALRDRFGARVEKVNLLEEVEAPSLPGCKVAGRTFRRANVVVSWPLENVGHNLPTLVSTLQGNLYELSQLSGLKLLDFEVPDSFKRQFIGSRHGIEGTRRLMGVHGRPMIGTIIKPSIGLTPGQTAELVKTLAEAGIDFVKDDELMANPPHSPVAERISSVSRVLNAHADRTGKRVMYAFNITDELDGMLRHYEAVVAAGGTCVMLSLNSVGLAGVKRICDLGKLAVHGHRNGWGMFNRHPALGMEFAAYQKLWRLAGVDQIHVNGLQNKFWEPDESVIRSIQACLGKWHHSLLPVVSSGQWGGQASETYRQTNTQDLLYLAGGGIMAHPDGVSGGVRALHQAWTAAIEGITAAEAASKYAEFGKSFARFGQTKNP